MTLPFFPHTAHHSARPFHAAAARFRRRRKQCCRQSAQCGIVSARQAEKARRRRFISAQPARRQAKIRSGASFPRVPDICTLPGARSPSAQMRRSDREIAAYPIRPHARAFFYPARSERKHSNTPTGAFPNAVRGFAAFCLDRLARAAEDSASRRKKRGMPPVFPNPLPNPAFFLFRSSLLFRAAPIRSMERGIPRPFRSRHPECANVFLFAQMPSLHKCYPFNI